MINFLLVWAEQIITALIIVVIIEMILPESNNRKYIKVIFGIFIIYIILSPIISKKGDDLIELFKEDINIDSSENYILSQNSVDIINGTFDSTYKSNLISTIESSLEAKGYNGKVEEIEVDNTKNEIINLSINISDLNENRNSNLTSINNVEIEKIKISDNYKENDKNTFKDENENNSEDNINNVEKDILNYLSETFNIDKENIILVRD